MLLVEENPEVCVWWHVYVNERHIHGCSGSRQIKSVDQMQYEIKRVLRHIRKLYEG